MNFKKSFSYVSVHIFALLVISTLLFVSCGKDNSLDDMKEEAVSEEKIVSLKSAIFNEDVEVLDYKSISEEIEIEEGEAVSRGSWTLAASNTYSLTKGKWKLVKIREDYLNHYDLKASVTAYSGNPDLYTHGYSSGFRRINYRVGSGTHTLELKASDLRSNENYAYFSVYGTNNCRFKLEIYKKSKSSSSSSSPFAKTNLRNSNNTPSTSTVYGTSLNVFNDDGEGGQDLVGQCTWYAYGRTVELARQGHLPSSAETKLRNGLYSGSSRHAKNWTWKVNSTWYDTNRDALPINLRKRGMIVVWKNNTDLHGHVAFVEEVSTDKKSYRVSDFNRLGKTTYREKWFPFEGDDRIGLKKGRSWYPYFLPLQ